MLYIKIAKHCNLVAFKASCSFYEARWLTKPGKSRGASSRNILHWLISRNTVHLCTQAPMLLVVQAYGVYVCVSDISFIFSSSQTEAGGPVSSRSERETGPGLQRVQREAGSGWAQEESRPLPADSARARGWGQAYWGNRCCAWGLFVCVCAHFPALSVYHHLHLGFLCIPSTSRNWIWNTIRYVLYTLSTILTFNFDV